MFSEFKHQVLKFIQNCKLPIKLFHLHFTIKEELNEIVLENNEIIKIHQIFLPPNTIQYQTVYKTHKIDKILETAEKLYNCNKCTLIGEKLEVLFETSILLKEISKLPKFNYVEVHFKDIDFKYCKKYTQLLSYSLKNKCVVNAIRLHEAESSRTSIANDLLKIYEFYNQPLLYCTEVSIYDNWSFDIEQEWKLHHETNSFENILKTLTSK